MTLEVELPSAAALGLEEGVRGWRRYPAYKDSGVHWLGEVPAHWRVKRLKHAVADLVAGGTPETSNPENWTEDDDGVPWVAISDLTRGPVVLSTEKVTTHVRRLSGEVAS